MDTALWWSGLVAWVACGIVGLIWLSDQVINWVVPALWTKREFFAFVEERLRKRHSSAKPL